MYYMPDSRRLCGSNKKANMKASELMANDWILADYKVGKQVFAKVGLIDPRYADRGHDNIGFLPVPMIDDLEQYINDERSIHPIPLTEDILKANADGGSCSFDEFRSLYHLKNNGYHREISISFDKTWSVPFVEITGMGQTTIKVNMQYVHELQHALRLCGLTKLADNFKIE